MTSHILDLINSFGFELASCLFISLNIYSLYRDKIVKGMSMLSMVFYNSWAMWNVFYYFSLHQSWSYYIGVAVAILTTWWTTLAIYYCHKNK